jgi:hypothetical protein
VTALVPTITGMGDLVSGRVRRAICCQVQSGTRLTDLPYFSVYHYNSYSHFRRPEAAENKPVAAENKLFSAAKGLFSAASGRQKKLAENKALFSAAKAWPPKIAYFWRLTPWPPKITDYFRRPDCLYKDSLGL